MDDTPRAPALATIETYPLPERFREIAGAVNTCCQCQEAPAEVVVKTLPERALSFWCQACLDRKYGASHAR